MLPTPTPATPLALTTEDMAALDKARGWARFVGIIGFIVCGLMAVMGLISVVAVAMLPGGPDARPAAGMTAGVVAVAMLIAVGYFATYSWLAMRYAGGVRAHAHGDGEALTRAFWGLKVMWILLVVTYILSLLFTVALVSGLIKPGG
jgi:hypothetical protein